MFVLAAVTVTLTLPAVRLPAAVPLEPAATLPTPKVLGVTTSGPVVTVEEWEEAAVLTPWQPHREMKVARSNNAPADFPRKFDEDPIFTVFSIV